MHVHIFAGQIHVVSWHTITDVVFSSLTFVYGLGMNGKFAVFCVFLAQTEQEVLSVT